MKALERALWFAFGAGVMFVLCLALGLGIYFGSRSTSPPRAENIAATPMTIEPATPAPVTRFRGAPPALTFESMDEVVAHYEREGFVKMGQFPRSDWPATVASVQEGVDEISFTLKGGARHRYSGYEGYRMKVVKLLDASGKESAVVLRSKVKEP